MSASSHAGPIAEFIAFLIGNYMTTQSPFQLELALSSLGIGVMGFLLYSNKNAFRAKVALVIAVVIFGWGAALGHVYQSVVNHDYAVNNTGLLLFSDVAINAAGLVFVLWHAWSLRRARTADDAAIRTDALVGAH